MPGLTRLSDPSNKRSLNAKPSDPRSPPAGSPGLPPHSGLLSVGSILLHDNIRCDILRSPLVQLGTKALMPGQPTFALSRLTLQLRFASVDPERSTGASFMTSSSVLEYVDARVHLSSSMALPSEGLWGEPLHLADSLAGDTHYERIVRAGNALLADLKTANLNREDAPVARPTGGFLVKQGDAPIIGMLGAQWIEPDETHGRETLRRKPSHMSSASAPLESMYDHSSPCQASHWEGEPSGSGTGEIIFQLRPLTKCGQCGVKPLQMLHVASKKSNNDPPASARTPTALHARNMHLLPNKTFRLVCNLLSYDDSASQQSAPEEFFAHFSISFYFSDDNHFQMGPLPGVTESPDTASQKGVSKGCCALRKHNFVASIKVGKEGDMKVCAKKAVDVVDALAKLEGKGRLVKSKA